MLVPTPSSRLGNKIDAKKSNKWTEISTPQHRSRSSAGTGTLTTATKHLPENELWAKMKAVVKKDDMKKKKKKKKKVRLL